MLTRHQKSPLNMATSRPPILILKKYQLFYSSYCGAIAHICLLLGEQLSKLQKLIHTRCSFSRGKIIRDFRQFHFTFVLPFIPGRLPIFLKNLNVCNANKLILYHEKINVVDFKSFVVWVKPMSD